MVKIKFEEEIVRFFNLANGFRDVKFYFPGLSVYNTDDSYEIELDRIIEGIRTELSSTRVMKIGLTLYPYVAEQRRGNIEARVGDLFDGNYDGVLIVPRPSEWPQPNRCYRYKVERTYHSIASLMPRVQLGLIALNLEQDHKLPEIISISTRIGRDLGCEAEIIKTTHWKSKINMMVRHGYACEHYRTPTEMPVYVPDRKVA